MPKNKPIEEEEEVEEYIDPKKKEKAENKYRGTVLKIDDDVVVECDACQYILKMSGRAPLFYVSIEHVLEEIFELKRKELAVKGKDKSIEGFIEASKKAYEYMEKKLKKEFGNPFGK